MRGIKIPIIIVTCFSFGLGIGWGLKIRHDRDITQGKAIESKSVRVLAYSGVFSKAMLFEFEKAKHVHVDLVEVKNPDELNKAFANQPGDVPPFDLITVFRLQLEADAKGILLQPIDSQKVKDWDSISTDFLDVSTNQSIPTTMPILWGLAGIAYNNRKVKSEPLSWKDIFSNYSWHTQTVLLPLPSSRYVKIAPPGVQTAPTLFDSLTLLRATEPPMAIEMNAAETAFFSDTEKETWKFILPEDRASLWILSLALTSQAKNVSEAYDFINDLLTKVRERQLAEASHEALCVTSVDGDADLHKQQKPAYLREVPLTDYEFVQ